ncbi:MAG: phospholipid carrier-dependent glycosyltransferase, partial [Promicromonosporaceae bacterium]|nr:phospholipid carrier-dependent glycosyltransferase [Promicromonosporaceae bacterium]
NPAAWRLGNAIIGILAVFIVIRLARRLFASTALGLIAGGLMAIDGTSIVHSRVALLDQFLMFFSLLAFYLLVIDRQWARHRLAERTAVLYAKLSPPGQTSPEGQAGPGGGPCLAPLYGPRLGFRYWRLLAGVSLGLAVGTKWSGLYVVAGFGLLTVLWDFTARRAVGIKRWWSDCLLIDAIPAFFAIVGTALLTYLLTWWAWWVTPGAWGRSWAADNPGQGISWLPEVARSFVRYHEQMWGFHTGLTVEHAYMANPLGFIVQWRPTSFHWRRDGDVVSAITSIGNPLLWWAAALAGVFAVAWGAYRRDWRALAVLSGTLAGWLPWLLTYARTGRTMFTFYTIAITPWVVLTLVYAFAVALEWSGGTLRRDPPPGPPLMPEPPLLPEPPPTEALPAVAEALPTAAGATEARRWRPPGRRTVAVWTIASVLALIALISALFYPLWTAIEVPWDYWRFLIRFSNWV